MLPKFLATISESLNPLALCSGRLGAPEKVQGREGALKSSFWLQETQGL